MAANRAYSKNDLITLLFHEHLIAALVRYKLKDTTTNKNLKIKPERTTMIIQVTKENNCVLLNSH